MNIINAVLDELQLSYASCGRTPSVALDVVAKSIAGAIGFRDENHVHVIFSKARNIENIPTQKTLAEVARNYGEEVLKYDRRNDDDTKAIEYYNPVSSWLPESDTMRRVNERTAIKNYCIATSDRSYSEYCKVHLTEVSDEGGRKVVRWKFPEKVKAFDEPIKKYLEYLYVKYLRMTPAYTNFPKGNTPTLEMLPPSVRELKIMINEEAKNNNL